jgi:tRNA(Ile)-lysidine synthase
MKRAAFGAEWLARRLAVLLPANAPVCVALSGGLDSVALLAALSGRKLLRAIHVNHGLHPNAKRWSEHCRTLCARLKVPLTVLNTKVTRQRGESLEAEARKARYALLAKHLHPGEALLTAHHEDDQLETVLLQLLRGAGVAGLAGMPECVPFAGGWLVRPLLSRSRAELEAWLRSRGLEWIEDDTNADERFDRNYLRRQVLPLVRARWPGAASTVARSARHAAEAKSLLESLARADVETAADGAALAVTRLRTLDAARRRNALRFWILRSGHPLPDSARLEEMAGPLLQARADANPEVRWNGTLVRRQGGRLSVGTAGGRAAASEASWSWRANPELTMAGGGSLRLCPDPKGRLDLDALPETLTIRPRRGGERLRPRVSGRTRTLKALLQEEKIPAHARGELPLVFAGPRLIAVADLWLDATVQAAAGAKHRGSLLWRR